MRTSFGIVVAGLVVFAALLPVRGEDDSASFTTHETCALCHDETRRGRAMRDAKGRNVAPVDLWRSSMMANASRDPLWRAVVALEKAATPTKAIEIETLCSRCHAPMASGGADTAADGVSCTVCHQVLPEGLGTPASFSGGFRIGEDREIFGPHASPFARPMEHHTDYRPTFSEHVVESSLCGSCHTLYTSALGPDGTETGARLAEQTPYLEWRNSAYSTEVSSPTPEAASCRDCHARTTDLEGAVIRTRIVHNPGGRDWPPTSPRTPFGRHVFVGGNALVPRILHASAGPAAAEVFEETLLRVHEQLQRAARLTLSEARRAGDRLRFDVRIENETGHRLPTAHPTRRVWLEVVVQDVRGAVQFSSGRFDAKGRLVGEDGALLPIETAGGPLAPHRDRIRSGDEVAIYEARMVDAAGAPTFLLTRGARYAKDDRLLPRGWRPDGPHADETAPRGVDGDDDFEGGRDVVHYDLPLDDAVRGPLDIRVRLLHQTVGARWVAEWLALGGEAAQGMRDVLLSADLRPSVIATAHTSR